MFVAFRAHPDEVALDFQSAITPQRDFVCAGSDARAAANKSKMRRFDGATTIS
jgi:hypothetical protein